MGAEKRIRGLWRSIPKVACKGLCSDSCTVIEMSVVERRILEREAGERQYTRPDGSCSLLKNGRCSAYDVRPTVCRLFGVVPEMACEHGCEPVADSGAGFQYLARAEALGGSADPGNVTETLRKIASGEIRIELSPPS